MELFIDEDDEEVVLGLVGDDDGILVRHERYSMTPDLGCSVLEDGQGLLFAACDAPLRGGLRIGLTGGSSTCTSGFVFQETPRPPASRFYLTTAGHCTRTGDAWYTWLKSGAKRDLGPTLVSVDQGAADVATILLDNPAWGLPYPYVYFDANHTSDYMISKIGHPGAAAEGTWVCRGGYKTLTRCGDVVSYAGSPFPDNVSCALIGCQFGANFMMLEVDQCAGPGDSGGPVWTHWFDNGIPSGTAFGTHSSSGSDSPCNSSSSEHSFATHISVAEGHTGAFLYCGLSSPCETLG